MSDANNTVVARYPYAQEEGTTYTSIEDVIARWRNVQVHYVDGVVSEVRTDIKAIDYGSTWDRVYHWSYVKGEGEEWVGMWKHTWTYG